MLAPMLLPQFNRQLTCTGLVSVRNSLLNVEDVVSTISRIERISTFISGQKELVSSLNSSLSRLVSNSSRISGPERSASWVNESLRSFKKRCQYVLIRCEKNASPGVNTCLLPVQLALLVWLVARQAVITALRWKERLKQILEQEYPPKLKATRRLQRLIRSAKYASRLGRPVLLLMMW